MGPGGEGPLRGYKQVLFLRSVLGNMEGSVWGDRVNPSFYGIMPIGHFAIPRGRGLQRFIL